MHTFFSLKKWRMDYFDDVKKCHTLMHAWSIEPASRLMVVSHKAKKEQSELPKTKRAMNYCVFLHKQSFCNTTS